MTGYFRRSVICIFDHVVEYDSDSDSDENSSDDTDETNSEDLKISRSSSSSRSTTTKEYGTYGLVINRLGTTSMSMMIMTTTGEKLQLHPRPLTLPDVVTPLPEVLAQPPVGQLPLREGGPVHFAVQMLHAATPDQQTAWKLCGTVLPTLTVHDQQSTAVDTDHAVYYRGNLFQAARAMQDGTLTGDVALFVGCSTWSEGQLEREVEQGCWLPFAAPATLALTGTLPRDHSSSPSATDDQDSDVMARQPPPTTDLWFTLMSALGEEEQQLANLLHKDNGNDENGGPCDEG